MPLYLLFHPAFDRSIKKLDPEQVKIVKRILDALSVYYESDCLLEKAQEIESRFFYKQLRKPFYEAGVESKIRVVIRRDQSNCYALLAGNHDQIKRFLANQ
jgi:mRNA-degrading endonuclease RelE of RelBE toxin-antitoxin system